MDAIFLGRLPEHHLNDLPAHGFDHLRYNSISELTVSLRI
jgi:hypothetical protein